MTAQKLPGSSADRASAARQCSDEDGTNGEGSAYLVFDRLQWSELHAGYSATLSDCELAALESLGAPVSRIELEALYVPLARLIEILFAGARDLGTALRDGFLRRPGTPSCYVVGIAGSVAAGKSSFARVLRSVLAGLPGAPRVELVTTDGFLFPTRVLAERSLMHRKGFPESYDRRQMLAFLARVKAGEPRLRVPVYSHEAYDIVPETFQEVDQPDILLFEGLNVLQTSPSGTTVASDFFDLSIYLDAAPELLETWYVQRFLSLQQTVFQRSTSYFHHYRKLDPTQAEEVARAIWNEINAPNLVENILPTRERARIVIRKGASHSLEEVWLRGI